MAARSVLRSVWSSFSGLKLGVSGSNAGVLQRVNVPLVPALTVQSRGVRQVVEKQDGKTTTIEGHIQDLPAAPQPPNPEAQCPIYRWNLQHRYNYTVNTCLSVYLPVHQSVRQSVHPSIHPLCVSFCISVGLLPDHKPKLPEGHVPKRPKQQLNRYLTRFAVDTVKPIYKRGLKWCKKRMAVGHPVLKDNVRYGKKPLYTKH
uniref:Mitochondrial ribosomal protein S18A n=1 Tax=Acanthochromis polyacanthus TaxID=80966 RepID=A0A3Q1EDU1_9TELE